MIFFKEYEFLQKGEKDTIFPPNYIQKNTVKFKL